MYELSGTLAGTGLPALLRFLAGLHKTGALHLTWSGGTGHILLEDGRVTGAILGAAVGLPALEELMARAADAAFSFEAQAVSALAPTIDMDLESLLLHLDRPARETSAVSAMAAPPASGGAVVGGHCPELGFADDRRHSFSRPTRLHRCFAGESPVPLTLEQQRDLCLSGAFGVCPRLRLKDANAHDLDLGRSTDARSDPLPASESTGPGASRGARGSRRLAATPGEADVHTTTAGRANGSAAQTTGAADQAADERTGRGRRRAADSTDRLSTGARARAGSASLDGLAAESRFDADRTVVAGTGRAARVERGAGPGALGTVGRAGAAGVGSAVRNGPAMAATGAGGSEAIGGWWADRRAETGRGARGPADAGDDRVIDARQGDVALAPVVRHVHGNPLRRRHVIVLGAVAALAVLVAVVTGPRLLGGREDAGAAAPTRVLPGSGTSGPAAARSRDTAATNAPGTSATGAQSAGPAGPQASSASRAGAAGSTGPEVAGAQAGPSAAQAGPAGSRAPGVAQTGTPAAGAQAATASQTGVSGATGVQPGAGAVGEVVLDEHFDSPTLRWSDNPAGPAQLTSGAYRLWTRQAGRFVALGVPLARTFEDVTVSATAHKAGGPPGGGFGLILRDQAEAPRDGVDQIGHFYVLEVGDRGEVGIWRRENQRWIDLVPWQTASAVHTGTETNTLVARAAGPHLTLTVNGTQVAAFDDPTYRAGRVGVFVGGDGNSVILDRLTIATP